MCNTNLYYHRYSPTKFDDINVPWYLPNSCPFTRLEPTDWPPFVGTYMSGLPKNPTVGTYGTCTSTLKGYLKDNSCQVGMYPSNIYGDCQCCDQYGHCGSDNPSPPLPIEPTPPPIVKPFMG